jgi:hypothetical protein
MASQENAEANAVLLASSKKGFKLWRNHRGGAWQGKSKRLADGNVLIENAKFYNFGLGMNGGSDFIGFRTIIITPEMVGQKIAQLSCVEVKARGKLNTAKQKQKDFIKAINEAGGYGKIVDSPDML